MSRKGKNIRIGSLDIPCYDAMPSAIAELIRLKDKSLCDHYKLDLSCRNCLLRRSCKYYEY